MCKSSSGRGDRFLVRLLIFVCLAVILYGCAPKLIATYDGKTQEATLKAAKLVDKFYGTLLETNENRRQYSVFTKHYVDIEAELNALVLRNEVRNLNEDSTEIAQRILSLWQKYKDRHKERDTYSTGNAKLDRKRFARMFAYAVRAEGAKKPPEEVE